MIIRKVIFTRGEFNGNYSYSPYFKVYKAPKNFVLPEAELNHHPVILEFNYKEVSTKFGHTNYSFTTNTKFEEINKGKKNKISKNISNIHLIKEKYNEYFYLLNALSNDIFINYDDGYQMWGTVVGELEPQSTWFQKQYITPNNFKFQEEGGVQFLNNASILIKAPYYKSIDYFLEDLFNVYFGLPHKIKGKILNSYKLFSKTLEVRDIDLSLFFVCLVSCIESLYEIEMSDINKNKSKRCSKCSSILNVGENFANFIDKYGFSIDENSRKKFYKLRSDIVHKGKLFSLSDNNYKWFLEDKKDLEKRKNEILENNYIFIFENLVKCCFRNFLIINKENFNYKTK